MQIAHAGYSTADMGRPMLHRPGQGTGGSSCCVASAPSSSGRSRSHGPA